jgi:carbamate kinase
MTTQIAVVAIGGNSLIKDKQHQSVADQYEAMKETSHHISDMIFDGWNVALAHGNGPQVGFILRRSELAAHELHEVPLDACVADTQGALGYALQQNLYNEFLSRGIKKQVVTLVTQVEVDANDPAFQNPSKPIGSFMDEETAVRRSKKNGWTIMEDAGRGWRRVVPSPEPKRIIEAEVIKHLVKADIITIAAGGGGIPVIVDSQGKLRGVEGVIDKDIASALLASAIKADLFLISTSIERVMLYFNQPNERAVDHMTLAEAKEYMAEGVHFVMGSMKPKMQSVINFLENGGKRAIITTPENIEKALAGNAGTTITVN